MRLCKDGCDVLHLQVFLRIIFSYRSNRALCHCLHSLVSTLGEFLDLHNYITVSNSPNPPCGWMRLCKHGKSVLLLKCSCSG